MFQRSHVWASLGLFSFVFLSRLLFWCCQRCANGISYDYRLLTRPRGGTCSWICKFKIINIAKKKKSCTRLFTFNNFKVLINIFVFKPSLDFLSGRRKEECRISYLCIIEIIHNRASKLVNCNHHSFLCVIRCTNDQVLAVRGLVKSIINL